MSKELLNKIRGAIDNNESPKTEKPVETPVPPVENPKPVSKNITPAKVQPAPKKAAKQSGPNSTGFEQLQEILKAEKEGFTFNRRIVYIDDNIGEALDILRKKAKINSNVLASYLLKQFLLENKDLIKGLKEKKQDNIFLD
jgi:hypothetical protein